MIRMSFRIIFVILLSIHHFKAIKAEEDTSGIMVVPIGRNVKDNSSSTTPKVPAIVGPPKKLIGGDKCGVENYPFMVSLRRLTSLSHFCAGTLFRSNWVLTAGHCMAPHVHQPHIFTVIAGISEMNQLGIQRIRVKEVFVHPEYNEDNNENDIALISLEHNFVITELVKPIDIPNQVIHEDIIEVCPGSTAIGWGWHAESKVSHIENGSLPHVPVMQCVFNLQVLSEADCRNARAGLHLHPNTFCTMVSAKENLCQGDSGGPLFCENIQYGVISSGFSCNNPGDTPGYYTRVDRVLNFVKECLTGKVDYSRNLNVEIPRSSALDNKHNSIIVNFALSFTIASVFMNLNK